MKHAKKTIPNRLWRYRKLAGYSQKDVAAILGIYNTSMISRWESGQSMPSGENLIKLSKLYKTLVNELYYELGKEYEKDLFKENLHRGNGP